MIDNFYENKIIVLDFGSQYTQLIARRIRELEVYCEIHPYNISIDELKKINPKGIVLSGSPSSVYEDEAPNCDINIFNLGIPVIGICYGMQLMVFLLRGEVIKADRQEYGEAKLTIDKLDGVFAGLDEEIFVWMSHGDYISKLPQGFEVIGHTRNTPMAAIAYEKKKLYGLQFHPEVVHTPLGKNILKNFVCQICECKQNWTMGRFIEHSIEIIKTKVGDKKVVCALSGGVDSSVTAILIHKAIGDNLICIFVNNGLLRKGESKKVIDVFKNHFQINLHYVNAEKQFLDKLKGVTDPEQKRKIIGHEFISIFENEARSFGNIKILAQGTLYPDVIESVSVKGPSATIKTHHNVGGLPANMNLELIEPLRELFKDEVREVGKELGMADELIYRQPFPGPGLAIRIIGEVTDERLNILREADTIVLEEIKKSGIYYNVWQSFAVLLPIKTVGVMGDSRTYENVVALRIVTSKDGMTADWAKIPYLVLSDISNRIINEVKGINRVVYDISSKPPSTIEWE
ncbi:glutamine-hydrolyzing GMP synthase [Candidatus Desantisbacteria bacterium]|nr:glutamine-hydrolyzing GMP synthase [Candidatus Desantisbacteria bacterium]